METSQVERDLMKSKVRQEFGLQSLFNFWGAAPYGGVAQLGEHLLCKQGVIGSIPFISTRGKREENDRLRNLIEMGS